MAFFRYKGVVIDGEVTNEDGTVLPNIKRSTQAFGFAFTDKKYTEVPDDAVAYSVMGVDRLTGKISIFDRRSGKLVAAPKVDAGKKCPGAVMVGEKREFTKDVPDEALDKIVRDRLAKGS